MDAQISNHGENPNVQSVVDMAGGGGGVRALSSDTQFGFKFAKWRRYLVKFMDDTMQRKKIIYICINLFIHFSFSDLFI